MKRPCLYSSDVEEVILITLIRFAGGDVRRIKLLRFEVVPWRGSFLGFFRLRRSAAAKWMYVLPAGNPTLHDVAGDPFLILHFRSLPHCIFTRQRRHTSIRHKTALHGAWFQQQNLSVFPYELRHDCIRPPIAEISYNIQVLMQVTLS